MIMDEMKEVMDLNTEEEAAAAKAPAAAPGSADAEKLARQELEEAREAENKAYAGMSKATNITARQRGVLKLVKLEQIEEPTKEQLDEKCRLILESYFLPHIAKDGFTVKLDPEFTRGEDPDRDYIEAKFINPTGKELSVGYNYKTDKDGKNIMIFEKTFENVILKPGEPERYVLYGPDGEKEIVSLSAEQLKGKLITGEVVKVENGYFRKAKDENGEVREGTTTPIVEDEGIGNVKIIFGNNEQQKFSIGKNGQLTCATTNDVTTATIETRKFVSGPVYASEDAARAAAEKEIQPGETNPRIEVNMEGTTIADFNFIPAYTTSVELVGLSRKLGKGMEDYDPNESDEENLRKQLAKPIRQYLDEKGFHVMDITCENITADVTENVGFMNTMRTYQMTGGTISVTYTKRQTAQVSIKQGFLGRGQGNNVDMILSQLPAGCVLLNEENINWKNSKEEVAYVMRQSATGSGSATTTQMADERAAESAIQEAQKLVVRNLNGGIASGIREAIAGKGTTSTVANVRARINDAAVSKEDMTLTHKDPKYAYSGSCDKMVSTTENKLVSVTSWHGSLLTYVEPTDPVIDKGIPTDDAYEKYINEGDASGILLFEESDKGLRRYMTDVTDAQSHAKIYRDKYVKARNRLREVQDAFDQLIDEKLGIAEKKTKKEEKTPIVEEDLTTEENPTAEETSEVEENSAAEEEAATVEETPAAEEEVATVEETPAAEEEAATVGETPAMEEELPTEESKVVGEEVSEAQAALLSIFGDTTETAEPATEAEAEPAPRPVITEEMLFGTAATAEPEAESAAETEPATEAEPAPRPVITEEMLFGTAATAEPEAEPAPRPVITEEMLFGTAATAEPATEAEAEPAPRPVITEEMLFGTAAAAEPEAEEPTAEPVAEPAPRPVITEEMLFGTAATAEPATEAEAEPAARPVITEEMLFGTAATAEPVAEEPAAEPAPAARPVITEEMLFGKMTAEPVQEAATDSSLYPTFETAPKEEELREQQAIEDGVVGLGGIGQPVYPTFNTSPIDQHASVYEQSARGGEVSDQFVVPMPSMDISPIQEREEVPLGDLVHRVDERDNLNLDASMNLTGAADMFGNTNPAVSMPDGTIDVDAAWEKLMQGMPNE